MSICAARGLLQTGLRWRIGSGNNIKIWDDAWFPKLPKNRIQMSGGNPSILLVSELNNHQERMWDEHLLTMHLEEEIAERVHCIPIAGNLEEDMIVWGRSFQIDGKQRKLPTKSVESERRRPPEGPFLKVNLNAAFKGNVRRSCTGIIIRNWEGQVVGSKTIVNCHILTSFAIEAIACLRAVSLGIYLGIREALVEGDALSVIKKMRSYNVDGSVIAAYIHDAKKKKAEGFTRCSLRHVHRHANRVANMLAREGLRRGGSTYLEGCVSDFVRDEMENDRCERRFREIERNGGVPL
ncbi:hypothetical protein Golax_022772 [Gossypium laxum]|uniref:RNase H type-1 domain-containing protein n=1 Tax=Gossypium laxum TaxID=34288 RepID=A0A7J9B361_9ROSI|nr:hypothetical protein [Gossypium laxum]